MSSMNVTDCTFVSMIIFLVCEGNFVEGPPPPMEAYVFK